MANRHIKDTGSQVDVTLDPTSLLVTAVLLSAHGWRKYDDTDALRHDPAFRLETSYAAGLSPLAE